MARGVNRGKIGRPRKDLVTWLGDESWFDQGRCRGLDPNLFHPLGQSASTVVQTEQAKAICRTCPVRESCREYAVRNHIDFGIWGGTSPNDRREIRRRRRANAQT